MTDMATSTEQQHQLMKARDALNAAIEHQHDGNSFRAGARAQEAQAILHGMLGDPGSGGAR